MIPRHTRSPHPTPRPLARTLTALGIALLLLWSASDARAVRVGVIDSYEGWSSQTGGAQDYRGYTRYDRLVEVLAGWKAIGVDFGVLVGDNMANKETGWPLLLDAIEDSGVTVYLVLGNHDWVNQVPNGGGSHPDSCFNLKPQEQDPSCPNTIYFLDYLWNNYGYDRPWYSFSQDGVLFVFLADELFDSRGLYGGGISDVHDEQFYWFRDLIAANNGKPIVVFTHHPVYDSVAGSNTSSPLQRLGWRPRVGEDGGDTVSITHGRRYVFRSGGDFDPRRVTRGAEFQIQGDTDWYEIAAVIRNRLVLTTPYQGPTDPAALFWAGGHFNELTQIMKDPGNSIEVVMSGHTSGDFQRVTSGLSQLEVINNKIFAYSGTLRPKEMSEYPLGDFFLSRIAWLTQTPESHKVVPGALIRVPGGNYIELAEVRWHDILGGKSTVVLASQPDITRPHVRQHAITRRTDRFTETRVVDIDGSRPASARVFNLNYATGWRSGALLEGSFEDPDFPSADLTDATLEITPPTARLTPTSAHGVALYGTTDQHFYSVEVELKRVSAGGGGIAFRAQDGDNFYYFELDESSQTFKLGKCESGVLATLAEVNPGAPLVDDYTLKVRVQGDRIQTFVGDQPAIMFHDTSFPTGRYGLFSRSGGGSDFEDLEVIGDIEPFPDASALPTCHDGMDNDGDGLVDYPEDPGCSMRSSTIENPECQDGINNDTGEDPDPGLIDFDGGLSALGYVVSDPDPQCVVSWRNRESARAPCGLGFELALILPGLMWLHRRRRRLH